MSDLSNPTMTVCRHYRGKKDVSLFCPYPPLFPKLFRISCLRDNGKVARGFAQGIRYQGLRKFDKVTVDGKIDYESCAKSIVASAYESRRSV